MARHDVNQSKTQRLLEKAAHLSSFKNEPIVVPRGKLDIAHMAVKKERNKNKYFIAVIVLLVGVIVCLRL